MSQPVANLALSVLSDAVLRVATRLRAPVIDLRRVMTKAGWMDALSSTSLVGWLAGWLVGRLVGWLVVFCLTKEHRATRVVFAVAYAFFIFFL